jgi:short subunit dehydrogenase-like uncharacterized protein
VKKHILIYGANGYTGELIVALAVAEGCQPLLAGRSLKKIEPLAGRYKLPFRIFDLDDTKKIASNIADVAVVLNCAGPFTRTASVIAEACIQEGVHYLDITGEVEVFELLAAMGDRARSRGVMLMPGVGFDVVPSDCLAAHLKRRMPDAVSLTLAFQASGKPSRGTATTMVENLHRGGLVRRSGRLVAVPSAARVKELDFGYGQIKTMSIPWGDLSTAWVSTAIPDIEVYMVAPMGLRLLSKASRYLGQVLATSWVQDYLKRKIDTGSPGPNEMQRRRGFSRFWGEVRNAAGQSMISRLMTVEGYELTSKTAWDIAKRAAAGQLRPGFCTPSMLFGPDYILNFSGSKRVDL